MFVPDYVREPAKLLEQNGFEVYVVGGAVRDTLLGRKVNDYDLCTSASADEMLRIFADYRTVTSGIKHGTVAVISDGHAVEITRFRVDGEYADSRHPLAVRAAKTVEEDLARRDLTVNAMAYSPTRGIIDPFGGRADIERRTIRTVGDPCVRFAEDALRIMRVFRFAATLGFDIESETLLAADAAAPKLKEISAERITVELLALIEADDPTDVLEVMRCGGVFRQILPQVTVCETNVAAVRRLKPDRAARLAALLYGNAPERISAALAALRLPKKLASSVFAAATAPLPLLSDETGARRFVAAFPRDGLTAAQVAAAIDPAREEFAAAVKRVVERGDPVRQADLAVNGAQLIAAGVDGGANIGRVLAALLDGVIEDPTKNTRETLIAMALEINCRYRSES